MGINAGRSWYYTDFDTPNVSVQLGIQAQRRKYSALENNIRVQRIFAVHSILTKKRTKKTPFE